MTTTEVSLDNVEYKVNLKEAIEMLKVKNVTRKCKNCGKLVPVINAIMGQKIYCPECGTAYVVKQEIKFNVIIDPVIV